MTYNGCRIASQPAFWEVLNQKLKNHQNNIRADGFKTWGFDSVRNLVVRNHSIVSHHTGAAQECYVSNFQFSGFNVLVLKL